jgi:hypothetical protein
MAQLAVDDADGGELDEGEVVRRFILPAHEQAAEAVEPPTRCAPASTGSTSYGSRWTTPASTPRSCARFVLTSLRGTRNGCSSRPCWRGRARISCSGRGAGRAWTPACGSRCTSWTRSGRSIVSRWSERRCATLWTAWRWLRPHCRPGWQEGYARRLEDAALPKGQAARGVRRADLPRAGVWHPRRQVRVQTGSFRLVARRSCPDRGLTARGYSIILLSIKAAHHWR